MEENGRNYLSLCDLLNINTYFSSFFQGGRLLNTELYVYMSASYLFIWIPQWEIHGFYQRKGYFESSAGIRQHLKKKPQNKLQPLPLYFRRIKSDILWNSPFPVSKTITAMKMM